MDTQKMITAIFLIAVAVGAVGAVAFIVIDGTQGGDHQEDYSDCVNNTFKNEPLVGKFYEYTTTDPQNNVTVLKYEFTKYDAEKKLYSVKVTNGSVVKTEYVKSDNVYPYIYCTNEYYDCITVGDKVIDTPWGKVLCNERVKDANGLVTTCYVGYNQVLYEKVTYPSATPDQKTVKSLTNSTLFNEPRLTDPDMPSDSNKKVKTDVVKGDFIELTVPLIDNKSYTDKYTVTSVDGTTGKLTVENERNGVKNTVIMTVEDFRDMLVPVMGGAVIDASKSPTNISTVWGDITVNVYLVSYIQDGKTMYTRMHVDANNVMFKIEYGEGVDDTHVRWDSTFILKDTSMLEGYKKPAA